MSYRRFSSAHRRTEPEGLQPDGKHHGEQRLYTRNPTDIERMTGIPYPKEDWKDGIQVGPHATEPILRVKDYTHDVPMEKRTTCVSCKHATNHKELSGGMHECWCRDAFVKGASGWKRVPTALNDNGCRDWLPAHHDCIG